MTEARVLAEGLHFGEGPRWRDGRLWYGHVWIANAIAPERVLVAPSSLADVVSTVRQGRIECAEVRVPGAGDRDRGPNPNGKGLRFRMRSDRRIGLDGCSPRKGGMTMQRVAAMLAALATATLVAGCGGHGDREHVRIDAGAGQFNLLTRGDALPEGHPPVGGHHRALPEGHPPVAGDGHGLPPGHPVCPAGRQQLEQGAAGGVDGYDSGPRLIST